MDRLDIGLDGNVDGLGLVRLDAMVVVGPNAEMELKTSGDSRLPTRSYTLVLDAKHLS